MSVFTIPATTKQFRQDARLLSKPKEIICLDIVVYARLLSVKVEMALRGRDVKAKIVKGF